ncbi:MULTISPECIES: hypothetical protein [Micromonospora]|uniref:Beta-galactosidase n=1 Tax=Micromonospora yangpuensis TaxID=683228 RepID=A0A1C6UN56_9ACTN|nr:hypothetical protein [Micromonospora yangpuensis]GGM09513.1 hypothetical protein GCM10012279_29470 [Micromonospora yangpuensis]SCL55461.1 hypothetical protein GA0070617_2965 [Micromonospora yangpuensis]
MRRPGRARSLLLGGVLALALTATACSADPAPEPAPSPSPATDAPPTASPGPAPSGAPVVGNPFGARWDWARYEQFTPYLKKLAGSATYHEISWCAIEKTEGNRNFTALDRIAERSRDLGIMLHIKIRTGMCWATGGSPQFLRGQANKTESAMPQDMAAYQGFVTDVVKRYAPYGVREYAIENEVNAPQYWAGSPADYKRLVASAAEAIHAADPQAKVVDSGISSVGYGMGVADRLLKAGQDDAAVTAYRTYFQRRIGTRGQKIPEVNDPAALRAALANDQNSRNIAYLSATEELLDEGVVQIRQLHYYEHFAAVPALLEYLRAETPAGVPTQAWEVGQFWRDGDGDAASRSDEMVKTVSQLVAGGINQVLWLPLAYHPNNRAGAEVRYGLLDPDGTERLAGTMMAELAGAAKDATVEPVATKGLTGVAFRRGEQSTLVLWSASADAVSVPAAPGLTSGKLGTEAASARSGAVSIGTSPVLLAGTGDPATILSGVR